MTKDNQVVFEKDSIYLKNDPEMFVMMEWETELMEETAKVFCSKGGNILEIGFGMGILSTFIQQQPNVKKHTIVEVHPQIHEKLLEWSKNYTNVEIIKGDWLEVADFITSQKYDGIHYDADCYNCPYFRELIVEKCINSGGIFSYFSANGKDIYNYKERLNRKLIKITTEIPKNKYHNSKECYVNWIDY